MKKITEMKWHEREYEELSNMVPQDADDEYEIRYQMENLLDRCLDEGIDDMTVHAIAQHMETAK